MAYNGIGLTTPRGTGTNGYVQRNLSYVRPKTIQMQNEVKPPTEMARKPNKDLLEHEKRRQIELRIIMYEEKLKQRGGYSEEEIARQVQEYRQGLQELSARGRGPTDHKRAMSETHQISLAKEKQNAKLEEAFGIKGFQEGQAFKQLEDKMNGVVAEKPEKKEGELKKPTKFLDRVRSKSPPERRRSKRSRSRSRDRRDRRDDRRRSRSRQREGKRDSRRDRSRSPRGNKKSDKSSDKSEKSSSSSKKERRRSRSAEKSKKEKRRSASPENSTREDKEDKGSRHSKKDSHKKDSKKDSHKDKKDKKKKSRSRSGSGEKDTSSKASKSKSKSKSKEKSKSRSKSKEKSRSRSVGND